MPLAPDGAMTGCLNPVCGRSRGDACLVVQSGELELRQWFRFRAAPGGSPGISPSQAVPIRLILHPLVLRSEDGAVRRDQHESDHGYKPTQMLVFLMAGRVPSVRVPVRRLALPLCFSTLPCPFPSLKTNLISCDLTPPMSFVVPINFHF